jgi:hypothetical protein
MSKVYIELEDIINYTEKIKPTFAPLHRAVIDAVVYGISNNVPAVELPRLAAWEHKTSTPGGIHDTYGCTNCGFTTGWTTDFCGGCGAYMRGDFNG